MNNYLSICSLGLCTLLAYTPAQAEVVTLYDGIGTPVDHGWKLQSGAGHLGGSVTETYDPGSSLDVESKRMRFHSWSYDTGFSEFLVSSRIRITHAQYNFADAGLMFSVLGEAGEPDRLNSFYLTPDHVGFMDLQDMAPIAAEQYHDFTILYRDNALSFFVDDSFESILAGTAVPELYRVSSVSAFGTNSLGVIQIGDQSNDFNVNSRYRLESVSFLGITPVPEPETTLMLGAGIALLSIVGKRRRVFAASTP